MRLKHFIFVFMTLFFFSCSKDKKTVEEEHHYSIFQLEDTGWKSRTINNYTGRINYTATEVPIQYYILKNNPSKDLTNINSIYRENNSERIIEFEFRHDEDKDLLATNFTNIGYAEGVKYLSFSISKDFKVITSSNDTIQCLGVNFERNFKIAPFKRALLYFKGIPPKDNIKLVYQDKLFGNGILKFNFNETPIKL